MSTIPVNRPRRIDPSLVEVGDDVLVEHRADRGVIRTVRGIVAKRVDSGQTRYLMTSEGATIFAWEPGRTNKYTIVLFGREAPPQEVLFDIKDEVVSRIAS